MQDVATRGGQAPGEPPHGPSFSGPLSPRLRRLAILATSLCVAIGAVVALTRFDGLHATDAAAGDSTRWFVDQTTNRLALIDGYSGTTLVRVHPGTSNQQFDVVDGPAGAFVLYRRSSEARSIDDSTLELGEATPITELTATHQLVTVTRRGLSVIDADTGNGTLFDQSGIITPFGSPQLDDAMIAPDGALWGLDGSDLVRVDGADTTRTSLGVDGVEMTLVGDDVMVLDRATQRARFADGAWIDLPTPDLDVSPIELVLQEPGPADECGWVAGHDAMFCVSAKGIERTVALERWVVSTDRLAVGGEAAVVVTSNPSNIVQFNPLTGELIEASKADVPPNANLAISAEDGLVWIEHVDGKLIWSANQWTLQSARKDDERAPLLGAEGETIEVEDDSVTPTEIRDGEEPDSPPQPDNNGIDDPPVANDDVALVRSGAALPLVATANDYDPDGEAIVIQSATAPSHGSTTISSASTISYQPEAGFVGPDSFEYAIVDGDGDLDTATVNVEVVGDNHPNEAPVARNDIAETVVGVPVVIDVLGNDYDPERDALQLKSETGSGKLGEVRRVQGPSGSEAIELTPTQPVSKKTVYKFEYKAQDAFGAVTDPGGTVTVVVRPAGAENLPPVLEPDAVRAPALTQVDVPVLANDRDPDGDPLTITNVDAPSTLNVYINGDQIEVNAKEAARDLETFSYTVDDGNGHEVTSTVLVKVEPRAEANRPPVAVPDVRTAVAGQRTQLNPADNDYDPDNDEIKIVEVGEFKSDDVPDATADLVDGVVLLSVPSWASDRTGRGTFEYKITDGNGHESSTVVTVSILPKALNSAPIAVDDHESTDIDTPVTVNVLLNDYDPSGQEQTIVGDPVCEDGGTAKTTARGNVRFVPPKGEVGIFRCTYRVSNPQGLTANARIIITVLDESNINRPPQAASDYVDAEQGEQIEIRPLSNDSDPDGDDLVLDAVDPPREGSARKSGNSIMFTAPQRAGVVSFAYQVSDDNGGVSRGNISVTVQAEERSSIVAQPDFRQAASGSGSYTMPVLANDLPSGELGLASVSHRSGPGSVSVSGQNVVFTFDSNAVGVIEASYTARASDGQTATATAQLTLVDTNKAPITQSQTVSVNPNGSGYVDLRVSDPDNDPLTIELDHQNGTGGIYITSKSGTRITFTADASATGGNIAYSAKDGIHTTPGQFTIRVNQSPPPTTTTTPDGQPGPPDPDGSTTTVPTPPTTPKCDGPNAPPVSVNVDLGETVDVFEGVRPSIIGTVIGPKKNPKGGKFNFETGVFEPDGTVTGNISFDYFVTACDKTINGPVTVNVIDPNANRPPQTKNISVTVDGSTRVPISDFAADTDAFSITKVVETSGFGVGVSIQEDGQALGIDGSTVPTNDSAFLKATVTDSHGESAAATLELSRIPDISLDKRFVMTTPTYTAEIVPVGWRITGISDVTYDGVGGAVVAPYDDRFVAIALEGATGPGTGSFIVYATNGGVSRSGTVTFEYRPDEPKSTPPTVPPSTVPPTSTKPPTTPPTTPPVTTTPPTDPPTTPTTTTTTPPPTVPTTPLVGGTEPP